MPLNIRRKSGPKNEAAAIDLSSLSDSHVIALLANGEHSAALRAYFGEFEYQDLQRLAQLALKKTATRGTVYLLPGVMGSTLGWVNTTLNKPITRVVWLNPQAIAAGDLLALAMPSKRKVQALSVMLPGYLKLKLRLMGAGFNVTLHAFDWRKSVLDSGQQFLQSLADDGVKNSFVVGHSMGGLVARAALHKDAKRRIARIVQIGTPNLGSYALVQALRGAYPTVRKIAALDPQHSTDQLVRHVFRTLPGLYELLPTPERKDDLDLLSLASWPHDLLGPDATLLGTATRTRALLGDAREGCYHIVGVHQETATAARLRRNGLEYAITDDGDGTVPRALTEWPQAPTWYVKERHGNLTANESVANAVIDLLIGGDTRALPNEWQPPARKILRWVSDAQLRNAIPSDASGKVEWQSLPLDERRRILEPVVTPAFYGVVQRLVTNEG